MKSEIMGYGGNKLKLGLAGVVAQLCQPNSCHTRSPQCHPCNDPLPSRAAVSKLVDDLRFVLFPGYFGAVDLNDENLPFHVGATLDGVLVNMEEQIKRGYCFNCQNQKEGRLEECRLRAQDTNHTFLSRLPAIRDTLFSDVQAAFEGDPAASHPGETIFCYPGLTAITNYRLAHELELLGVPIIPRMITEHAHSTTGIDIHPGATIGKSFFIDHGTGVVIGETCIIGEGVRIYQGVTLGAKSFAVDERGHPIKGIPRHPIVEDDVVIYAGATILGRVTIGRGSIIGGNVWVVKDIPAGQKVTQLQAREERFLAGAGI